MRQCRMIKFDQTLEYTIAIVTASYRYNTTGSDIFML